MRGIKVDRAQEDPSLQTEFMKLNQDTVCTAAPGFAGAC